MLRAFVAVARTGAFQKAAELLGVRQPAISDAIRRLEDEAGVPLVTRSRRGLRLSELGQRVLPDAMAAVDAADHVDLLLNDGRAELAVGFMGEAAGRMTAGLLDLVRREANAKISLRRYDYADPTCGLASGETDLAIVWPPLGSTTLETLILSRDRRAVAVPVSDRLARRASLEPADLASRNWVLPISADGVWAEFRHPRAIGVGDPAGWVGSRSPEETLELVAMGYGLALVSEGSDEHHARSNVAIIPLAGEVSCCVALAWRAADHRVRIARIVQAASISHQQPGDRRAG